MLLLNFTVTNYVIFIYRDYGVREKSRVAYSQCARGRRWTRWTWTHCASVRTATTVRGTTGRRASSPARATRRRPSAPTVATACPRDPRWPPGDPDGATLRDSLQPQRTWPSTNGPPCDCHSLRCKTLPFFPRGWALTASLIIIVNLFTENNRLTLSQGVWDGGEIFLLLTSAGRFFLI
jgi:hypothetical protein